MKKVVLSITGSLVLLAVLVAVCLTATPWSPYRIGVVKTGSMSPTLPPASMIVVQVHDMHPGEPIMFRLHNEFITHRWVGTNQDGTLKTKGDANASADVSGPTKANVVGQVVGSVNGLGFWLIYLQNPLGIGSLLFGLLVVYFIWSIFQELSRDDDGHPFQAA